MSKLWFYIAVLATFVLAPQISVHAESLKLGTTPKQEKIDSMLDAYCSYLSGGFRICRARTSEDGDASFVIQQGTKTLESIPAPFWSIAASDPDGFFTYRGDMDGNGTKEIVLVSYEGASNGLGITYSTVYIFKDPNSHHAETPIEIPIQEFGINDNLRFDQAKNRTDILVTYWDEYDALDKRRGTGTYLVGKWFGYKNGILIPEYNRPTLARRLLNSFARERDNSSWGNRTPYKWLQHNSTHRFFREPNDTAELISKMDGRVESFSMDKEKNDAVLKIKLPSGKIVDGIVLYHFVPTNREANTEYVSSLGLSKNKYVLPYQLDPKYIFGDLKGKRVRIENYKSEYENEFAKLWFLDH
jgi:hypothetical protein